MQPLYITWDVNPVFFQIGSYSFRYYTFLFGLGLLFGSLAIYKAFKDYGGNKEEFYSLFMYIFFGGALGARIGHCLFYEPAYYLHHPLEIILPYTWENGVLVVNGFHGLASHGAGIGLLVGLLLFCRKYRYNFVSMMDYISLGAPAGGALIRLGNLMNSEIIGKITGAPWAFQFVLVDDHPRHPAQLYEALAYLLLFFINIYLYKTKGKEMKRGFLFGFSFAYVFIFRFLIEFLKENQVAFENLLFINMGQLLSLPYILIGFYFLFFYNKKKTVACEE